ncbi:hypothetical protein [Moraxella nonliquefaciens]|jgi:hypothetical protein|uniref:Uncharacterized protein n=1 Tax=Moraxella nonliquefaciens TaxID=478 RepID=A0A1B8QNW3_MORNO|nr:hypothetical protein [Moraxella nonliquefaciens]OBX85937.1 hypothetical protein A7456_10035 [Moraxella nonliquefaciens]QPT44897.1 hypothetical protein I6G26_02325 [Moraxella nonliquefaciens]QQC29928.1 hypothetical protein I6H63_01105 [Moraxella nonliquefaciens]
MSQKDLVVISLFLAILIYFAFYHYYLYYLCKNAKIVKNRLEYIERVVTISKVASDIFWGNVDSDKIKNDKNFRMVRIFLRFFPVILLIWFVVPSLFE